MINYNALDVLASLSGLSFVVYGSLCLTTNHMKKEFERYGLAHFRKLTGALELLGGLGLLLGFLFSPLQIFSALGLSILMLMGSIVRIRLKDSLLQIAPAFFLMLINFYIFIFGLWNT